jgi:hypothetical protein
MSQGNSAGLPSTTLMFTNGTAKRVTSRALKATPLPRFSVERLEKREGC